MTNDAPDDNALAAHALSRARAASAKAQAQRDATAADTDAERAAKKAALIDYAIAGRKRGREERAAALLRERGWAVLSPHQPRDETERTLYEADMTVARSILAQ